VIVHAGFHKTGTSSLQIYLAQHRDALAPWFDFHGQGAALHRSAVAARIYASRQFPWRLKAFRAALRADLPALPDADTIVLSREQYCGVLPGHRRWNGRLIRDFTRAGVPLGRVLKAELITRFGPGTDVEFLYTTRDDAAWLHSTHGHLLRTLHLTEDLDAFRAGLPDRIDLAAQARRIGARVQPHALHIRSLEELAATRLGPATAVLDLAGVPDDIRAGLPPAAKENSGMSAAMEAAFLALNRSGRSKRALARIKAEMIEAAGRRT
jgi:hypothetical protein